MSLGGKSPESDAQDSKNPLFNDEPKIERGQFSTGGGLFSAEDNNTADTHDSSPWGFTSRRQKGGSLVKSLLPSANVPESYVDAFDALLASSGRPGPHLSVANVMALLAGTSLSTDEQDQILKIVKPSSTSATLSSSEPIDRGEFNVIVALIGLAQEGDEVSLDSVDERKRRLPNPQLLQQLLSKPNSEGRQNAMTVEARTENSMHSSGTTQTADRNRLQRESFNALDTDPWGSPSQQRINGVQNPAPHRTTSEFSTSGADNLSNSTLSDTAIPSSGAEWSGYNSSFVAGGDSSASTNFAGQHTSDQGNMQSYVAINVKPADRRYNHGTEEYVTVTALPDKEGIFLFQYRNYEVTSPRRNSKVIRRFSDFVWLLDCLHKRYPFRQLPLLPPKRVSINGNHIAADDSFIEKRRRGLVRFINALVRHPVLNQEQLVIMFLTVPTELSVWRKQATISISEEFAGKVLPPTLEDSLPNGLEDLFTTVRSGVQRTASTYVTLCALLERLIKRKEGLSVEFSRFSSTLLTLNEISMDTYKFDTNEVPLLNEGIKSSSRSADTHAQLLQEEARVWDEGALEDFKRMRDRLVSMRDMFDRRDRLARDNIPTLEKRISSNEVKLEKVRAKPDGARKAGDAEKLEDAIMKDKESIVQQHARQILIKECVRNEIIHFQSSQYQIARLHQDWTQEGVKYAELLADCWRRWSEDVEGMPSGAS